MSMSEEEHNISLFPVGAVIRIRNPGDWHADIAGKMTDRLGEVTRHVAFVGHPIVSFHAIGRRKAFQKSFSAPERYLDRVTDAEEIAAWRKGVADTASRAEALIAKKRAAAARS